MLKIKDLTVSAKGKPLLRDISLEIKSGEVHYLIGPNGAGKSVLAFTIMGSPNYTITKGNILYQGEDITSLPPHERAKKGIFLSFQSPPPVEHLKLSALLHHIKKSNADIESLLEKVGLKKDVLSKPLNTSMSGGEKKKSEILQLLLLDPSFIILDEIDTGLDADSLLRISAILSELKQKRDKSFLVISHNLKMLDLFPADYVHIMHNGKVVFSSPDVSSLKDKIEKEGYGWIIQKEHKP